MDDSVEQDAALLDLFDDLDSWSSAMQLRERADEVRDRSRSAYAEVTLAARLMASSGLSVSVDVRGLGRLRGRVEHVGQGWFRIVDGRHGWALRTDALVLTQGLADRAVPEQAWSALARLSFATVLRRVADGGEPCLVVLDSGAARPTLLREARVVRVGADFVEIGVEDEPDLTLVALAAVTAVRTGI